MIISHKKKFVFIHIYKTGGTTVSEHLKQYSRLREKVTTFWPTSKFFSAIAIAFKLYDNGGKWINGVHKHATAMELREYLGNELYENYFSFCIVRNPYDFLVSLYSFIKNQKKHPDHQLCNQLTFKEYILKEIKRKTQRQSDFVIDEKGECIVDYIGKTETLQESMNFIFGKLNISRTEIGQKNRSKRKRDYRQYYDDELKEAVYEYFKKATSFNGIFARMPYDIYIN